MVFLSGLSCLAGTTFAQVRNLEDELVRATGVKAVSELIQSVTVFEFTTDFCRLRLDSHTVTGQEPHLYCPVNLEQIREFYKTQYEDVMPLRIYVGA